MTRHNKHNLPKFALATLLATTAFAFPALAQFNAGNEKITNLADPTADQDGATKKYVDDSVGGAETDPQVNSVTNGRICKGTGTAADCVITIPTCNNLASEALQFDGTDFTCVTIVAEPPDACNTLNASWDSGNCTDTVAGEAHGVTRTAEQTSCPCGTSRYLGSRDYICNNGTWDPVDAGTCTNTGCGACPPPPPSPPSGTCFTGDTLVAMADGTQKPIEDIVVGDKVRGLYGYVNTVIALDQPLLGDRPLWDINNELKTTDDHVFWAGDRWGVLSFEKYLERDRGVPQSVITSDNTVEMWEYPSLQIDMIHEHGEGDEIAYGPTGDTKEIETLERIDGLPSETQLYSLVLSGSHTMLLNGGYVFSGWARDDDFDYLAGQPKNVYPYRNVFYPRVGHILAKYAHNENPFPLRQVA